MAQQHPYAEPLRLPQKSAIVVGLCSDPSSYRRLAAAVLERGLAADGLRAAGTEVAISAIERQASIGDAAFAFCRERFVTLEHIDDDPMRDVESEPLLHECFSCLSDIPSGGAPWQGSWRANAFAGVIKELGRGAIILVVEAHSLEEQRDWARALLKCGCAFVQTHDGRTPADRH